MSVARDDDAQGDPRVSSPRDAHATWSDPRPRAFLESPTRNARDHTLHHAHAHACAPYTPPPEASASSVVAAAGSALAALGKEVLARGRFPGCDVDLVAVRAATSLDFRRCVGARAEHANLVSRAKHTPRAVRAGDVLDAWDARDDVAHVYVTYDHPESRHTLGVARVAAPAFSEKRFSDPFFKSSPRSSPRDLRRVVLRNDHGSSFESAQHPHGAFRVDTLFATGLATALDPSRGPERVRALLLRACEEVAARTTTRTNALTDAAELVIEAPQGALPREVMRRVLDAAPVGAVGADDTRDDDARAAAKSVAEKIGGEPDGPSGSESRVSLRLRRTRYRLRSPRDSDDGDDGDDGDDTVTEDAVEKSLPEVTEVTEVDVSVRRSRAEARRALASAAAKALDVEVPDENDLVAALATVVGASGAPGGSGGSDPRGQSIFAFSAASGEAVAALETFRGAISSPAFIREGSSAPASSGGGVPVVVALVDRFPTPPSTRKDSETSRKDDGAKDKDDAFVRLAVVSSLKAMRDAVARDGALALVMRVTQTTSVARDGNPAPHRSPCASRRLSVTRSGGRRRRTSRPSRPSRPSRLIPVRRPPRRESRAPPSAGTPSATRSVVVRPASRRPSLR